MNIQAPKGTKDILPGESYKWEHIMNIACAVCKQFGFSEIRTPVFEDTALFERGIGDSTDIVQKEMYTFLDKGGRSITLKPEGTAGVVRAYIEHSLFADGGPTKLFYFTPCYRYDKPQAGRYREHHQFGVELFGSEHAIAEGEVISLLLGFLTKMGISNLKVNLNSIGCWVCKPDYNKALKAYFADKDICELCDSRLEKNPMRVFDCKADICKEVVKDAPKTIDCLCDACQNHMNNLKEILSQSGINYVVDSSIVRGQDYYTRTVFEISFGAGSQEVICGGGRYDGLVEQMGGKPTPAIGFGLGIERLLLALEKSGVEIPDEEAPDIFIGYIGEGADIAAFNLARKYRAEGKKVILEIQGRSPKAQMKYANKIGAKFSCIIGEDEITQRAFALKNMQTGEEEINKL